MRLPVMFPFLGLMFAHVATAAAQEATYAYCSAQVFQNSNDERVYFSSLMAMDASTLSASELETTFEAFLSDQVAQVRLASAFCDIGDRASVSAMRNEDLASEIDRIGRDGIKEIDATLAQLFPVDMTRLTCRISGASNSNLQPQIEKKSFGDWDVEFSESLKQLRLKNISVWKNFLFDAHSGAAGQVAFTDDRIVFCPNIGAKCGTTRISNAATGQTGIVELATIDRRTGAFSWTMQDQHSGTYEAFYTTYAGTCAPAAPRKF